jgi:hypothetical protein
MFKPTIIFEEELKLVIKQLSMKPQNVEELLSNHKSVKFQKISSFRFIKKFENGEFKYKNEFLERPSFKQRIEDKTNALSKEIQKSLIRKKKLSNKKKTKNEVKEQEDIFMKIPGSDFKKIKLIQRC